MNLKIFSGLASSSASISHVSSRYRLQSVGSSTSPAFVLIPLSATGSINCPPKMSVILAESGPL